jgi:pSer/pThr/pTyr-binding forkhead associated (FHA) protein
MDDAKRPAEGSSLGLQGPHWLAHVQQDELPPRFHSLRLVLQPGGLVLELARPDMLLGRHSQADVRLPLPDVSRQHCRFVFMDNVWHVFDLDSLNGTFVNGERVQHAVLQEQDIVVIGGFRFAVELNGPTSDGPAPARDSGTTEEVIQRIAEVLPHPTQTGEQPWRKAC